MKNILLVKKARANQSGVSIVEMMIALSLGSIILLAVSNWSVSSAELYRHASAMTRLQSKATKLMNEFENSFSNSAGIPCLGLPRQERKNLGGLSITIGGDAADSIVPTQTTVNLPPTITYGSQNVISASRDGTGVTVKGIEQTVNVFGQVQRMSGDGNSWETVADGVREYTHARVRVSSSEGYRVGDVILISTCRGAMLSVVDDVRPAPNASLTFYYLGKLDDVLPKFINPGRPGTKRIGKISRLYHKGYSVDRAGVMSVENLLDVNSAAQPIANGVAGLTFRWRVINANRTAVWLDSAAIFPDTDTSLARRQRAAVVAVQIAFTMRTAQQFNLGGGQSAVVLPYTSIAVMPGKRSILGKDVKILRNIWQL